jgi:hypothetical protein
MQHGLYVVSSDFAEMIASQAARLQPNHYGFIGCICRDDCANQAVCANNAMALHTQGSDFQPDHLNFGCIHGPDCAADFVRESKAMASHAGF